MCHLSAVDRADIQRYISDAFPGTRVIEADGDVFFIHDPDRDLPAERLIPWATIVTSNAYDSGSDLDRPGVFRLNIGVPKARFQELMTDSASADPTALDTLLPHPEYGKQYWVSVLNPDRTWPMARELLREAYEAAVRRHGNVVRRRQARDQAGGGS